jgi:DNA-binding MarR family transcriptional regulator
MVSVVENIMDKLPFNASLWLNVDIAMRNLDQVYARGIEDLNMPVIEFYILRALYETDGQRASSLAAAVGRVPTSFTPILDGLEEKELIVRRPDSADRRAVLIYLTEDGKALRRRVQSSADHVEQIVRREASDEEWTSFKHVLARLVQLDTAGDRVVAR